MLHSKMTSNNYVQMRIFSVGKSFLYGIYYERKQLNRNDLLVVLEFFGIKQRCNLSQSCKGLFIQPNAFKEFKSSFCTKIAVDFFYILFTWLLLGIRQYIFLPVNLKLFYDNALYFLSTNADIQIMISNIDQILSCLLCQAYIALLGNI